MPIWYFSQKVIQMKLVYLMNKWLISCITTIPAVTIWIVLLASAIGTVAASRNLHNNLLDKILHAPMSFFDTTPLGRILNRFSRDLDVIDSNIPMFLRGWLFSLAPLLSTIVIITYSASVFLAVFIPLGIIYYFVQVNYDPLKFHISIIYFPFQLFRKDNIPQEMLKT